MMRLPPMQTCNLTLIDDIVAERQNGRNANFFAQIAPEWRQRVQDYITHRGSPEFVQTWPTIAPKRKKFLNLYLSPTPISAQGQILRTLRDHELNLCPACGEAGRPNTLDHYLPKNGYPHFCVTPFNLFPMCDACQKEKGEKTGNVASPRFFIHPYFDVFVGDQVMDLTIHPPFHTPTFSLQARATLGAQERQLVDDHVRELQIKERYSSFFKEQYKRLVRLVGLMRSTNQDVVINLQNFSAITAAPSRNSWEHIFYGEVVANQALLAYLVNENLPAYP